MRVPEAVLDLLADLRRHLQEDCEPPVYVSDRRLVKALALLQVCLTAVLPGSCAVLRHGMDK